MDTDKTGLFYEEITYRIRGAIFKVFNELGNGHKEIVYHRALAIEMRKHGIAFKEEVPLDVRCENEKIGIYRPDFVIEGSIIIEIKAVTFISKTMETQLLYYLKGTDFRLGLLVNFGSDKLDIRRKIWSGTYQRPSVSNPRPS